MVQEKLKKTQLLASLFKSNFLPLEAQLPKLSAKPFVLRPDPQELQAFNTLTGWQDSSHLAPTWLQMRALPTYLNLITAPQFPFSPLGLVHLEKNINLRDALPFNSEYHIHCAIDDYQQHPKGMLIKTKVTASIDQQLVYQADASLLALIKAITEKSPQKVLKLHPEIHHETKVTWQLGADIGRRYAKLSGDYNLIHIHPLTAKMFGFKRHIAHGMYLKARAMSELFARGAASEFGFPLSIAMAFKKPVFLPAELELGSSAMESELKFDLYQGTVLHATGTLQSGES